MPLKVEDLVVRYKEMPIIKEALKRLATELPKTLRYHVASHTDDVIHEVLEFGVHDGLKDRELELLSIAAAYHDLGFTYQAKENEGLGAEFAREAMQTNGSFTQEEIQLVHQMILDTQLKITPEGPRQVPSSRLSGYLLDADVSNLGRDDFMEKTELYRAELMKRKEEYFPWVIKFLEAHQWYTPAARKLRTKGKESNIAKVRQLVSNYSDRQE